MKNITWTIDQILGMAPDHLQLKAAESAAVPGKWINIGRDEQHVWGEFSNNQQSGYHTLIALPHLGLACNCPSRKRPCRHSVALAILFLQQTERFAESPAPAWVSQQVSRSRPLSPAVPPRRGSSDRAQANYRRHLRNIQEGMQELELWLRDMIHQGLAMLTQKPALYWREMANRLVDTEAYATAAELRRIATLPGDDPKWTEQLLRRIGRLYLLTQGFARYDSLLPETQSDLRYAVGWFADPNEGWSETLHDTWLVLGKRHEWAGQKNRLRVWLWGQKRRRPALLDLQPGKDNLQAHPFFSGDSFSGTMQFYPSAWPVRAHMDGEYNPSDSSESLAPYHSMADARRTYGRVLSLNPWLRHFPLLLQSFQVEKDGERWLMRDAEGCRLPLPQKFLHGWHLQAVAQTLESAVFGEWDGAAFQPLTIFHDQQWLDLHTLRGVK